MGDSHLGHSDLDGKGAPESKQARRKSSLLLDVNQLEGTFKEEGFHNLESARGPIVGKRMFSPRESVYEIPQDTLPKSRLAFVNETDKRIVKRNGYDRKGSCLVVEDIESKRLSIAENSESGARWSIGSSFGNHPLESPGLSEEQVKSFNRETAPIRTELVTKLHEFHIQNKKETAEKKAKEKKEKRERAEKLEFIQAMRGQLPDKKKEIYIRTLHYRKMNARAENADVLLFFRHLATSMADIRSRSNSQSNSPGRSCVSSPGQYLQRRTRDLPSTSSEGSGEAQGKNSLQKTQSSEL